MNNSIRWTGAHISYFKVKDDTHMTSMKIVQFLRPLIHLAHLRPKFFHAESVTKAQLTHAKSIEYSGNNIFAFSINFNDSAPLSLERKNLNNSIGWTGVHIFLFKVRDDTHMTSMKITQFLRPLTPPCPSTSKILKEN